MEGTEAFGDQQVDEGAWAIVFNEMEFNKLKVESYDQVYTKEYTKEELMGKLQEEEFLKDKAKIE